ncbi:F0F1 ATP synthase subunit delta [Falsirhodobacter algicola]|uniref:ATP synthase subunit delta n=1 Tax=Falsirhodobacter algicola TaxID=2692330 RepID=A0A8J8SKW5_9RHOB|nr:F0F1 ATP synthase subunit delta [Falsirhodobacter algicola]QUS35774.1 F0F1 ATP synthase subunit delta [Falsirhodobacter algicola]
MSEPASISTGIATRYATAVFELAKDANSVNTLESNLDALDAALDSSADLRDLIASPVYSRADQQAGIRAVGQAMGLSELMVNSLSVMAAKRRLFALPRMIAALRAMIADDRGEVLAEVTSAQALTPDQAAKLSATLKAKAGKDVKLKTAVDESLIGGLVVKLGSTMIDTSVRSKLAALKNAMKEVG